MNFLIRNYTTERRKEDLEMEGNFFTPEQIHGNMTKASVKKTKYTIPQLIMLGFMAGLCIALGAEASNVAMHGISHVGISRVIAGAVFPVGLITLLLLGGELFTGNTMMLMGLVDRRIHLSGMLKNWFFVFVSNFVGGVFIAYIVSQTGQWNYSDNLLGAMTIKIALGKVTLSPWTAICSGIMCNIFVCAAVLIASGAQNMIGKIFGSFFPIFAFVISGFEHCVANMYYIPAGIMASHNAAYVEKAKEAYGITASQLSQLTVGHFLYDNLLYVTIGNIIGGGVIVGLMYYFVFVRKIGKAK